MCALLKRRECLDLFGHRSERQQVTKFALGKRPKFFRRVKAPESIEYFFGKMAEAHNLGDAGTRKPVVASNSSHGQGFVVGQHLHPFQGTVYRVLTGLRGGRL